MLWGGRHFVEVAVDAVSDAEFVAEGFEVDVGGLVPDGLSDDGVDELDDGGVVGGGQQFRVGGLGVVGVLAGVVFGDQFVDDLGDAGAAFGEEGLHGLYDVPGAGHDDAAVLFHDEVEFVDEFGVEGLVRGEGEGVPVVHDGDDAIGMGDFGGDGGGHLPVDGAHVEFHELCVEFLGDELEELVFLDDLVVVEDLLELLPGVPAFLQHLLQLLLGGQFPLPEDLPEHADLRRDFDGAVVHIFF